MAPDLFFAVPGDIESRTGGYIYDRRLMQELRQNGWSVQHLRWADSFPFPTSADVEQAARSLAACPDGSLVLIDGLAFGTLPALAEAEGERLRLVALVHHPLALETGLGATDRHRLTLSERRALQKARAVIVTSKMTAETLRQDFGVRADMIIVAEPGTDPARRSNPAPREAGAACHILSVGTLTPRKGHDVLVEALARVVDLPWTCTIAGSLDRAPITSADIRARIARHGLAERIVLVGEIGDMTDLYEAADLFVLASRYEGYGMAFAEALQQGLPIIGTTAGAIPGVVPSNAGVLVAPNDIPALAAALREVLGNPLRRADLAVGARAAAASLPRWSDTATKVAATLQHLRAAN